eukprot:CAMPEP_0119472912 /NCGR_PEP_ID=MMETSP1344-20130328/4785_1 /TAXON_ID=236787 /ORGANISM="Florenciella parvula, Strain CCMP2471" /LENGTH=48 /DNA_ID= /DNA_START= /DNA_END= /DNA_ORIENTATION=
MPQRARLCSHVLGAFLTPPPPTTTTLSEDGVVFELEGLRDAGELSMPS